MVACSSQEKSLPNTTDAALYLNIATIGQTRSGSATLPDNERMKSVRVIVLHAADGTVEHNRHYPLESPQEQKYILLKVKPNEKKKIFLFANEESVSAVEGVTVKEVTGEKPTLTDFFRSYTADMPGFEAAVKDSTFYVVRVATKFVVNFMSWRGKEVTVNDLTVANHADKNFLMAHVNDSEQNRQLFNGKTWIDWLKEVSDASSENDSYTDTEAAGWLKDYQLPAQADKTLTYTHGQVTVGEPTVDIDNPDKSKRGWGERTPVFYLPESMNLKADATDGEQEYTLTLDINGRSEPFVCKLPNLKALFRNTNVVVDITMYNSTEIEVDVIPYSEVPLDPVFGL